MSKKPTSSRLEQFFSELSQNEVSSPMEKPGFQSCWTWETNEQGYYLSIGSEVEEGLDYSAFEWIGQSLYQFALTPKSTQIIQSTQKRGNFPCEIEVEFIDKKNRLVLVRMTLFTRQDETGQTAGWRGFNQVISRNPDIETPVPGSIDQIQNFVDPAQSPATSYVSSPGKNGQLISGNGAKTSDVNSVKSTQTDPREKKSTTLVSKTGNIASMVVPFQMGDQSQGIIEILDENANRHWSEDDLLLAEDIARQLSLALENAELYAKVQLELSERVRAEKETLKRNQELSLLNQVGQQLSKLTSSQELLGLVQKSIGEIVEHRNLTIALCKPLTRTISFPIHTVNGAQISLADSEPGNNLIDYLINNKVILLIGDQSGKRLAEAKINLPFPLPESILGIPMLAGDRPIGAILLQDFEHKNAYTQVDADLLSTIAAQATTALENSNLFQEITNALQSLETRERYQANVAKAVATLTQFGTVALPEVLNTLAVAARNHSTYYAAVDQDEKGLFWHSIYEWQDPNISNSKNKTAIQHMPISLFPHWTAELRDKGWVTGTVQEMLSPEREYLASNGIKSILLLAVPGKSPIPNFLAFEQFDGYRKWLMEEINVLRLAADALSNTIVREDLMGQLQVSLDETENLYNASHRLALANDLNQMVAAITLDMHTPSINRGVLLLFDYDSQGKLGKIAVRANWYSGNGTPPPQVGIEYPRSIYEKLFFNQAPSYIDDIFDGQLENNLRDTLALQNIRSLAVLPLWASKRQLGILLLESEIKHTFTGRETRSYPPLVDQMATAIENQNLFEQTQAALAETGLLYLVSSGIAQSASPEALTDLVSKQMMPKNADQVSLFLAKHTQEGQITGYEVVGFNDLKHESGWRGQRFAPNKLPVFKSLHEVIMVTDITRSHLDPATKLTLLDHGIHSICIVPLLTTGKTVGFLTTSSRRAVEFTSDEIHLLQVASGGFAVALEKHSLLVETQRRALELQTAAEIARDTTGTLAIDELLSRIVNLLQDRFSLYHVGVYLLDEPGNFAVVREASGEAGLELKRRGHKMAVGSRSIIGSTTATGTSLAIPDVSTSPLYYPHPLLPDTRGEIGLPLKSGDKVIGALDLQYNQANAFSKDDLVVLQILSDQIAIAIENARAYELSQKAYEDMKEVDRVKSQFLANMSHELRTPLNSIIGFSRVILKGIDGPINETQKQDLSAIYNSGQHLLTLINNILDLSKIEAGKMELQLTEVNIADMVNSVMSTAVGLVKDKPIKLYQQIPADLPLVRADQTRVRQILLNFVSNAAKFTEEGTITVSASLENSPKGRKEIMVTITDTGSGIALEHQGKLFQPFSQVDDSPTRKTGGTGLGLSICRSMVEMHQGRIGLLQSEVGKGSSFFFTLPTVQIEEPQIELPQQNKVILAIDDDPQVISLYQRYLKPQGYQVIAVTNPKAAVERVKEIKPYAITLDIMMPEVDGWQILQKLKNDPDTRNIPIIICSILEDEEKGFSLGAADYLVKPFLQEDLALTIHRLNHEGQVHSILVIDDDPKDLRLVQKMLDESGSFQVTLAEGGRMGWDLLNEKRPDVVILDLFMPDMDGFTLLSNMRSKKELSDLPVIVLTGADLTAEQHAQLAASGQQMLTKGLLRERELLNTLENALRKIRS